MNLLKQSYIAFLLLSGIITNMYAASSNEVAKNSHDAIVEQLIDIGLAASNKGSTALSAELKECATRDLSIEQKEEIIRNLSMQAREDLFLEIGNRFVNQSNKNPFKAPHGVAISLMDTFFLLLYELTPEQGTYRPLRDAYLSCLGAQPWQMKVRLKKDEVTQAIPKSIRTKFFAADTLMVLTRVKELSKTFSSSPDASNIRLKKAEGETSYDRSTIFNLLKQKAYNTRRFIHEFAQTIAYRFLIIKRYYRQHLCNFFKRSR
jgi:hypothetical protein